MQLVSRASANAQRVSPTVWGAGALLAICAGVLLSLWWIRTLDAAQRTRQYQAALDSLAQMQLERQRLIDHLTRNRRLIAWREARIQEVKSLAGMPKSQPNFTALSQTDQDAAECFDVSLAEVELNLAHARERRTRLERKMYAIEDLIASQESRIRQMLERPDAE